MKVIFHAAELVRCRNVFNNVKNLLQASDAKFIVAIIFNGDAIKSLQKYQQNEVDSGISSSEFIEWSMLPCEVNLLACQNSMNGFQLTSNDLIDRAKPIKAGVLSIVELQQQGYAYIRP